MRLAFLTSHGGKQVQGIVQELADLNQERKQEASIKVIITNNLSEKKILDPIEQKVHVYYLPKKKGKDPGYDAFIIKILQKHKITYLFLIEYWCKISPSLLKHFPNRIINFHPSLLPKYAGQGMYGKRLQQKVLASKDKETGVTAHLVTDKYDQGRILARLKIPISRRDSIKTLSKKIAATEQALCLQIVQDMQYKLPSSRKSTATKPKNH